MAHSHRWLLTPTPITRTRAAAGVHLAHLNALGGAVLGLAE